MKTEICIIDDEPDLLEAFTSGLKSEFEVHVFSSAGQALEKMSHGLRPEVIVTDLKMPEMDGFTLIQELKLREIHSELVVVSGHANKSDVKQAMALGVRQFLDKPFALSQLQEAIVAALLAQMPTPSPDYRNRILLELIFNLEQLAVSHFDRAAMAENFICDTSATLYESNVQRIEFLRMLRNQRDIYNKISLLKKMCESQKVLSLVKGKP